jgi:hypothetical protein
MDIAIAIFNVLTLLSAAGFVLSDRNDKDAILFDVAFFLSASVLSILCLVNFIF